MHGHVHADIGLPRVVAARLRAIVVALFVLTLAGVVILRPTGEGQEGLRRVGTDAPRYPARVTGVMPVECPFETVDAILPGLCRDVSFMLQGGPDEGTEVVQFFPDSPTTPSFFVGDRVVLAYESEAEEGFEYSFVDRLRKAELRWLALLFAIAVVALGRLRGLAALGGLVASVVILISFVLPSILDGRPPVYVAIVGSALIAFVALYVAHGFNHMTTVALLGTLASLGLTSVLAAIFVAATKLSGFASEESVIVQLASGRIDAAGLVLAGVVIGALGALDDVTVTQASAVWELRAANPLMPRRELYRAGIRIGRDHIASTVNTLLLAYAGAAMPLLIFFVIAQQPLASVANEEIVATEIVRTLVGSIGLVASVPLTTWLASLVAGRSARQTDAGSS